MNQSVLKFFTLAVILFSFTQAEAKGKKYGGFQVGDTFKLKVLIVSSTKQTGTGAETPAPIPAGVPKYKKNDVVEFKIGAGGKLISKGIKIPFAHARNSVVEFNRSQGTTVNVTHTAEVTRKGKRVKGAYLYFFHTDTSGVDPVYRTVRYKLI
jgi:hypothetical protein